MHLTSIVAAALAATWLVDRIEKVVNQVWESTEGREVPGPEVRALGTLALASGLAAASGVLDPRVLAMESVAIAGAASILHDVQSRASTTTDLNLLALAREMRQLSRMRASTGP